MKKKNILYGSGIIAALLVLVGGVYGYMYTSSPHHIRYPAFEHYHIRTQIIVDGQPVDFTSSEFQEDYDKNSCSAELPEEPFDFHDGMDQMTHVHWDGMTGGEMLKYYGWNLIGGNDGSLGRRYDNGMMSMRSVPSHGNLLPAIPDNANFYVYVGEADSYERKSWDDFLNMDMEEFFGKKSNLSQDEQASLLERLLFPKAYAHGGEAEVDEHNEGESSEKTEEELTRINNLIGNVVIFVQENEPTKEQIQERFNNLVPLHDSTCGG